jgi:hypothetical protein
VFKNRIPRRMSESMKAKGTGDEKKQHNEKLLVKYYKGDGIREGKIGGECSMRGTDVIIWIVFGGKI